MCLVHDPRETSPYGKLYTVAYLNNMVGGIKVVYNNQPIDVLKQLATQSIKNNQVKHPVISTQAGTACKVFQSVTDPHLCIRIIFSKSHDVK